MAQLKDTTVNGTLMVNDVNVNDKMDLVDELNTNIPYYTVGDSVYINYWGAGVVTNGSTHLYVTVPINKPISPKVSGFTTSDVKLVMRQGNAYLGGSSSTGFCSPSNAVCEMNNSGINFKFEFNSSIGGTNNDAVAVLVRGNMNFY